MLLKLPISQKGFVFIGCLWILDTIVALTLRPILRLPQETNAKYPELSFPILQIVM